MFYFKKFRYRKREQRSALKTQHTIGILSVEPGCGATHLSISLAGYLMGVEGVITTVAEFNKSHAFSNLEELYHGSTGEEHTFLIFGISYRKNAVAEDIPELLEAGQECLILDFGSDYQKERWLEFRRCGIQIVLASMREWKVASLYHFLEEHETERKKGIWQVLLLGGCLEDVRELKHRYHIQAKIIPEEEDPFHINRSNIEFYQKLLEGR